jgi:hypothetical protein
MFFWIWRLVQGNSGGPRILWIRRLNRLASACCFPLVIHQKKPRPLTLICHIISERFTPWEIIVSTLTTLYAVRHFDSFVGLAGVLLSVLNPLMCQHRELILLRPTARSRTLIPHGMLISLFVVSTLTKDENTAYSTRAHIIAQHG